MTIIPIAMLLAGAPQTQADMNVQVDRTYHAADAALNAQYRATMAVAAKDDASRAGDLKAGVARPDRDPTYRAALLASQRAWLAFRDAQCRVEGFAYRGGSAQDMAEAQCATALTRTRTAELRRLQQGLAGL